MIKEKLVIPNKDDIEKQNDKRQYIKPCLVSYGDVRDITMGASAPFGESGSPATRCDFCP